MRTSFPYVILADPDPSSSMRLLKIFYANNATNISAEAAQAVSWVRARHVNWRSNARRES